jgi:exoribonuclease R
VATFVSKLGKGSSSNLFIYRIHDLPNREKITELGIFLKAIGYELKMEDGKVSGKDINALFKQLEGEAEEGIVKTTAIRSMAKAIYSTKNIGHFGLAFNYYTHFTSPIRRYPDVMVHRLLQEYLDGKKISSQEFAFYEKMATQTTERSHSRKGYEDKALHRPPKHAGRRTRQSPGRRTHQPSPRR